MNGVLDKHFVKIIAPDGAYPFMLCHSLKTLVQSLHNTPLSRKCDAVTSLLICVLHSSAVFSSTLTCCVDLTSVSDHVETHLLTEMWEDCVRLLVSLPNRAANVLKRNTPSDLLPAQYSKLLCYHIACIFSYIASADRKVNIAPISMLFSRIVVDFKPHGQDSGVTLFVQALVKWCAMDLGNARIIAPKLLCSLSKQAIESVSDVILRECHDMGCMVEHVLGNAVLESSDWRYILCTKIPFLKYSDYLDVRILSALAQYLQVSLEFRPILKDLVKRLLSVWSDRSALFHTPLEQHVYVTQALVLFSQAFHTAARDEVSSIPIRNLLIGVQVHLESPVLEVRCIGMITAEILTKLMVAQSDTELKFDYTGLTRDCQTLIEVIKNLKIVTNLCTFSESDGDAVLMSLAKSCGALGYPHEDKKVQLETSVKSECVNSVNLSVKTTVDSDHGEPLDSDDDIEPFDMSNDKPLSDRKKPLYLRDMLDGFFETNDIDVWCGSLFVCEELVQKQLHQEDESLGLSILEALISLEPRFPVENFSILQLKGAVAVVCVFPSPCAEHLAKLFHKEGGTYSVRQRLLMLHILTESAQNLCSSPSPHLEKEGAARTSCSSNLFTGCAGILDEVLDEFSNLISLETVKSHEIWGKQIDERVARKTRRVTSKPRVPQGFVSKFAPVAGSFFFPWIRGLARNCGTISVRLQEEIDINDDAGILVRFILSLSIIMQCSKNSVSAPRMGAELLEFAWSIRYHSEASVRFAAIGCVSSVLFAVPQSRLQGDLRPALLDAREWLQSITCGALGIQDTDVKCRELGSKVKTLLDMALS